MSIIFKSYASSNLHVLIMAGGRGTRISSVASDIPKPMIPVAGVPILERQLRFFARYGIEEVTISIGYLGETIRDYFGGGERVGLKIRYLEENEPLGTAGCLRYIEPCKTLLIVNGDIAFDVDLNRMIAYHKEKEADITLFTHPNQHPYDSAVIDANSDGRVVRWLNKEDERIDAPNRVNAGIHLLQYDVLDFRSKVWRSKKVDLDRDILKPAVGNSRVYAYDSPEYVKDMGTPERYHQVERDIEMGLVEARNLSYRQKAIFLDRDGTLNRYVSYISRPEQIELLAGAAEAVKRINESPYLAIVATNQPVIARGECSFDGMRSIHNRLTTLLGQKGAYLDDIVFCPHHPDSGFPGEVRELKTNCDCRKPSPGMLLKMAEKYHIDLSASFMIGDDDRDIEAGNAAGCHTVYLGEDAETAKKAEYSARDLLEAVDFIINEDLA